MAPWLCLMCLIHFNTIWIHLKSRKRSNRLKIQYSKISLLIFSNSQHGHVWISPIRACPTIRIFGGSTIKKINLYIYTWIIMDSFESRSVTSPIPIFILIHTSPICSSHIFPHEKPWVLPNDLLWGPRDDGWSAAAFAPSVFPGAGFCFGGDLGGAP